MRHKVIGLFAVYALYSSLGLFGIYLQAAESSPPARMRPIPPALPPVRIRPPAAAPAPLPINPIPQPVFGQFGNFPAQALQPGQFGQMVGQPAAPRAQAVNQFGGFGKFGGFGQQTDLYGKRVTGIEDGPAQIVASSTPVATPPTKETFVNPSVEPGKVKWHRDFDTACKEAEKSGKPVFLFQMMGKLDDQFC
jgi:hypothetical protein